MAHDPPPGGGRDRRVAGRGGDRAGDRAAARPRRVRVRDRRARDQPAGAWPYRSDGTVAIARLGVARGAADWQLRLASAVLGTAIVHHARAAPLPTGDPDAQVWRLE